LDHDRRAAIDVSVDVTTETVIERDREAVAAFAADPATRLVMKTSQGPFPMETTYVWATTPSGATRMTLRNRGEPTGFSTVLSPFMALAMRRANRKDLARLKALLESD
jgi:hypothetical protein